MIMNDYIPSFIVCLCVLNSFNFVSFSVVINMYSKLNARATFTKIFIYIFVLVIIISMRFITVQLNRYECVLKICRSVRSG